jgi:hypothetical protein
LLSFEFLYSSIQLLLCANSNSRCSVGHIKSIEISDLVLSTFWLCLTWKPLAGLEQAVRWIIVPPLSGQLQIRMGLSENWAEIFKTIPASSPARALGRQRLFACLSPCHETIPMDASRKKWPFSRGTSASFNCFSPQ